MTANAYDREYSLGASGYEPVDTHALERRARELQAIYLREAIGRGYRAAVRGLATLTRRWQVWAERRKALSQLSQLDDRLLADIGLSRGALLDQLLMAETADQAQNGTERFIGTAEPVATVANTNRRTRAA